jgi:ribosomal protein L12E/L44/L45/RPP1/RPP2
MKPPSTIPAVILSAASRPSTAANQIPQREEKKERKKERKRKKEKQSQGKTAPRISHSFLV